MKLLWFPWRCYYFRRMQNIQQLHFSSFNIHDMNHWKNSSALELSEDQVLMIEIGEGSQDAMGKIIENWKNELFRFFDRSLRNKADAEDLTQQVFIRIFQSASRYKPKAKFSTYLFTIARNLLIDEIKKKDRVDVISFEEEWMSHSAIKANEGNVGEWEEVLRQSMQEMPEYYSTAILLRVQRELSYREIGEIMKVSESRVKTWIHRAREHLKKSVKSRIN